MTTLHPDPGVVWFQNIGFRPAVWSSHRADGVDPQRLVPAPDADVAYIAKYDPFAHIPGYVWGTVLPASSQPVPAPSFPCCIETGPYEPLPPVAPVPVPASAGLLIAAAVGLALLRRRA